MNVSKKLRSAPVTEASDDRRGHELEEGEERPQEAAEQDRDERVGGANQRTESFDIRFLTKQTKCYLTFDLYYYLLFTIYYYLIYYTKNEMKENPVQKAFKVSNSFRVF